MDKRKICELLTSSDKDNVILGYQCLLLISDKEVYDILFELLNYDLKEYSMVRRLEHDQEYILDNINLQPRPYISVFIKSLEIELRYLDGRSNKKNLNFKIPGYVIKSDEDKKLLKPFIENLLDPSKQY